MKTLRWFIWFLCPIWVSAQGFNQYSGRNHPELDWQVAETPHFKILYPKHLQGIESEAAPILETSYAALSQSLKVVFPNKIPIYFSDEDEIVNGFASPIMGGYSCIWVHVQEAASIWTDSGKWLRKVVAHELTHLFHYQATKSNMGLLGNLFGTQILRQWTEGLAQYQTEPWDAQRGEKWLRTAVLDDRMRFDDPSATDNGRLLYATGNSQVRYFAAQYGDSALVKMLAHRKKGWFGIRYHDFPTAFRKTTGKTFAQFNSDWRRFMNVYYNTRAAWEESPDSLNGYRLKLPLQFVEDAQFSPADTTTLAVIGQKNTIEPATRLWFLRKGNAPKSLALAVNAPLSWRKFGKEVAFSRTSRTPEGSLINDLFLVNVESGRETRLTTGRRALYPAFDPTGRYLAFVASLGATSNVWVLDLADRTERQLTHLTGDQQLVGLSWSPDGEQIAAALFDVAGKRRLVLVHPQTGELTALSDGSPDFRSVIWSPDSRKLALTSYQDGVPNVWVMDVATRQTQRVTRLSYGAYVTAWRDSELVIVTGNRGKDDVYRISDQKTAREIAPVVPDKFSQWRSHQPPVIIPNQIPAADSLITRRYAYQSFRNIRHLNSMVFVPFSMGWTAWAEPLGKHQISALTYWFPASIKPQLLWFTYALNVFRPTIQANMIRSLFSATNQGYNEIREELRLQSVWRLDRRSKPYQSRTFVARLSYANRIPDKTDFGGDYSILIPNLGAPKDGQEAALDLQYVWRKQLPYAFQAVYPKDASGFRVRIKGVLGVGGEATNHVRGDIQMYHHFPMPAGRFYVYARAQAQTGESLPQDYLGLSRRPDWSLGGFGVLSQAGFSSLPKIGDRVWVRGVPDQSSSVVQGNRVLFGSAEYRLPPFSAETTVLGGLFGVGMVSPSLFVDAGKVWQDARFQDGGHALRYGWEMKAAVTVLGIPITAAAGRARTFSEAAHDARYFWRIQSILPF